MTEATHDQYIFADYISGKAKEIFFKVVLFWQPMYMCCYKVMSALIHKPVNSFFLHDAWVHHMIWSELAQLRACHLMMPGH